MVERSTLGAGGSAVTMCLGVPEALASEATHRVGDVCADPHTHISHGHHRGEISPAECQYYTIRWDCASASPRHDPPGMGNSVTGQAITDVVVSDATEIKAGDYPSARVFCPMWDHRHGDGDFLSPASIPHRVGEGSGLQRPGRVRCCGKLYLNRPITQLITAENLAKPVASVLPLEGREGAQLLILRGKHEDSRTW